MIFRKKLMILEEKHGAVFVQAVNCREIGA